MGLAESSLLPTSSSTSGASASGSSQEAHRLPKVPEWLDDCVPGRVQLYVYDMTNGLSPAFSALFSKFDFEALWHTSIVVFGREYSYGQLGMRVDTKLGKPHKKIDVGWTHVSKRTLYECLVQFKENVFKLENYDIFCRNCNSFAEELCQLLTGRSIPYEYRTFGQQMRDKCINHYNIHTQEELFKFVQTRQLGLK